LARIGSLRRRPAARRWLIVAALFVVTYGISTPLAAYGVFLPVLAEEFGWSRGAISSALSFNLLLGGLAAFPIGAIARACLVHWWRSALASRPSDTMVAKVIPDVFGVRALGAPWACWAWDGVAGPRWALPRPGSSTISPALT
jgi:hypothetical protein